MNSPSLLFLLISWILSTYNTPQHRDKSWKCAQHSIILMPTGMYTLPLCYRCRAHIYLNIFQLDLKRYCILQVHWRLLQIEAPEQGTILYTPIFRSWWTFCQLKNGINGLITNKQCFCTYKIKDLTESSNKKSNFCANKEDLILLT